MALSFSFGGDGHAYLANATTQIDSKQGTFL